MSFSGIEQWLVVEAAPLFLVGFALLAGLALLYFSAQSRKATRRRDRAGMDEHTFAESFAARGFDAEIALAVYRNLEDKIRIGFPILPGDDLDRDLGMDSGDVREMLRHITAQIGRDYLPGLVIEPIVSVAEMVRAVQSMPRKVLPMRRRA